jgi:arylsulfatase A-like enzyme
MERRKFLKSAGGAAVGGVLANLGLFDRAADAATARSAAFRELPGAAGARPKIIFFLVDELRFPSVFPDGIATPAQFLATYMPNTSELWRHGVKFTSHFAAGTACTPSRATLVTGLYPHQEWELATRTTAGPSMDQAFLTYGKLLRGLGYETPYIGKWHLSNPPSNLPQDYLEAYGFDGMTIPDPTGTNGQGAADDPDTADQAVAWLQSRARSETPFCLTVGFVNPHDKQYFWAGTQGELYEELMRSNGVSAFVTDYMSVPEEDNPSPQGFPAVPPNWGSEKDLTTYNKPSTHVLFREFQSAVWVACTDDPQDTSFSVALSPNSHPVAPFCKGVSPFSYWQRGLDVYTYVMGLVDQQIGKIVANVPDSQLGVRTAEAKLGTYSHWYPGTIRPIMSSMELEFYDYSTPNGRAETYSTPDDPRAKARESYLAFDALINAYTYSQLIKSGLATSVLGYGITG